MFGIWETRCFLKVGPAVIKARTKHRQILTYMVLLACSINQGVQDVQGVQCVQRVQGEPGRHLFGSGSGSGIMVHFWYY